MAYARPKMPLELPRTAQPLRSVLSRSTDARGELESLRVTNAHLLREIAELKEREAQALKLADRDGERVSLPYSIQGNELHLVSLGSAPRHRLARRRDDKCPGNG